MAYTSNYLKDEEKDRYYRQRQTFVMLDSNTNEEKTCLEIRDIKRNVSNVNKSDINYHKITNSDDLMKIAYMYYGDRNLWWYIADTNSPMVSDAYDLPVGSVLTIFPYNPRSYNY